MAEYYEEEEGKKGGAGAKILAAFLGFLFGIICTAGALAAIGYFVYDKMTVKEGIGYVNDITGANVDYSDYLTEEYAEKTVSQLIGSISELMDEFKSGNASLSTLEKVSPQVREQVEKLTKNLSNQYSLTFDTDALMTTKFTELGAFVSDSVKEAELGALLFDAADNDKNSNKTLMLLCYGEEGKDYTLSGNEVTMIGDAKATTVGDLLDGNLSSVTDKISVSALLDSTLDEGKEADYSDPVMRALLFGVENKTFTYDEGTNGITMLPLSFELSDDGKTMTESDGTEYLYDAEKVAFVNADGDYITATKRTAAYYLYSAENGLLCTLTEETAGSNLYYAADEEGNPVYNEPLTLSSLISVLNGSGENSLLGLLDGVQVGALFNLTGHSDKLMLSLAYGEEGKDYKIEGDDIVLLEGGKAPTTFGELLDSPDDVLGNLELGAVMGLNASSDKALLALAYGSENRYTVDTEGNITMNPAVYTVKEDNGNLVLLDDADKTVTGATVTGNAADGYTVVVSGNKKIADGTYTLTADGRLTADNGASFVLYAKATFGDLTDDPMGLIDDMELGALMNLDGSSDKTLLAIAYGDEGVDYTIDTDGKIVMLGDSKPVTVRELRDGNSASELIYGIRLGVVLKVEIDDPDADPLMKALAYGNEGTHYKIDVYGEVIWLPDLTADPTGATFYAPRTINDLTGDGASDVVYGIELGTVLKIDRDDPNADPLMHALAYGNDGTETRTVGDLTGNGGADLIHGIYLTQIITSYDTTDKITMYVLFGKEGEQYELREGKVFMLTDPTTSEAYTPRTVGDLTDGQLIANIKDELTIGEIVGVEDTSPEILKAIQNWKISDFNDSDKFMSLKVKDVLTVDSTSPSILQAMCKNGDEWTLNDLNDATKINSLKLSDVIEIDESNIILRHLKNSTLATVGDDAENLTVQQVFENDVYKKDAAKEYFVNANDEKLYFNTADGLYYTTAGFDAGTQSERALTGTWKYLLTDYQTGAEKDYKITEMSALVDNMTHNIQSATLRTLKDDGILEVNETFLGTEVFHGNALIEVNGFDDVLYMEDFTITRLTDYVSVLIEKLNGLT